MSEGLRWDSLAALIAEAESRNALISELVLGVYREGCERESAMAEMGRRLEVMRASVRRGLEEPLSSRSGLVGGDGRRVFVALTGGRSVVGDTFSLTVARALSAAEVNACMGRVVAAPTAGSCGVLPAVLLTLAERVGAADEQVVKCMFTAAAVGAIIQARATLAGAEGGCQAECGAAAAMAAAAGVELCDGTPSQSGHAAAISLKGTMGLVCDPVAGLVEVPCVKRNALAAANALAAIEMAMAGVRSAIPVDEVIDAMRAVAKLLPEALRETALGGLAATPTGLEIARRLA